MHNVLLCCPSARGIHPHTMTSVWNMRTALEKAGHRGHWATLGRMPLDFARNELAAAFMGTTADVALLLDDDVQLEPLHDPQGLLVMLRAIEAGAAIVSAPCRLRDHSASGQWTPFNVVPVDTTVHDMGGVRLFECKTTGLGAVAVHRRVFEKLFKDAEEPKPACTTCGHQDRDSYASYVSKGKSAVNIFGSRVEAAKLTHPDAPDDAGIFILDDGVFSRRVRAAGFTIHAAIDVPTCHDGMFGCYAQELEKFQKSEAKQRPALLGPDGKKL